MPPQQKQRMQRRVDKRRPDLANKKVAFCYFKATYGIGTQQYVGTATVREANDVGSHATPARLSFQVVPERCITGGT